MRVAFTIVLVLCLAALLAFGPAALDAHHDRQYRVLAERPLEIYQKIEPPWRDQSNPRVAIAAERDALPVMRIHYEKDYMVVRVKLPDGRDGYVFSGSGFRLDPPDTRYPDLTKRSR